MHSILFASKTSPLMPVMAATLAGTLAQDTITAHAAAAKSTQLDKQTRAFLNKIIPQPLPEIHDLAGINFRSFDLVIYFARNDFIFYPTLPGLPPLVRWHIDIPEAPSQASLSSLYRDIQVQVENLIKQGYLTALIQARNNSELVLDNLHEGILAHDMDRRIFFFNKAAEKITGFKRQDILGKDCHTIFTDGFCGNNCSFCDGKQGFDFPTTHYNLDITNRHGKKKCLEMSVVSITGMFDAIVGVVASFRDVTREHELAERLDASDQFSGIIGRNVKMQELFRTVKDLARSKAAVLIQGESGTGKELVAAAIHNEGSRKSHLFVPVNCGALPENLLESELFGHVRGAFTGAVRDKKGRFELADGGTLFLDEIGDISPAMQVKLLRVLQDGKFQRVGDEKVFKTDVRIVSATHKDLKAEIASGRFREDLYYRLCVVPVNLPPLRERMDDIPLLARQFLKRFLAEEERDEIIISPETITILTHYNWPGNVRELQNVIRFLLVSCHESAIRPIHLPANFHKLQRTINVTSLPKSRGKLQKETVIDALRETKGNRLKAAKLLNVSRATLYRFLEHTSLG